MTDDALHAWLNQLQRAIEQLCKENAELRQMVAALVIVISDGFDSEYVPSYEAMVNWAFEEFDADILLESLADYTEELPASEPVSAETAHLPAVPSANQQRLFSTEDSDDETTA